jgi:hypothetical protein
MSATWHSFVDHRQFSPSARIEEEPHGTRKPPTAASG